MERKWVSSLPTCKTPNSHKIPLLLPIMLFFLLNPLSKSAATETEPVLLHSKDKTSLLLFKSQIQDPNRWLTDWESPGSNWTGLTFSNRSGRVTSLNLTRMNLSGLVHPSLCRLLKLETLVLSHNQFYGTIPLCLGRLLYLKTLDLSHNMLRRGVPSSLMRLSKLTELSLNANHDLNDTVPHWIGNFSMKLEKIDLGGNSSELVVFEIAKVFGTLSQHFVGVILVIFISLWCISILRLIRFRVLCLAFWPQLNPFRFSI